MSKTNNTVKQAVLDAEKLKNSIKEESKETLKSLLNEVVKDAIRESINEDEKDYDVVDNEEEKEANAEEVATEPVDAEPDNAEPVEAEPVEEPAENDAWSEFSDYKVGDEDTYDLTNVEDYDKIVKVYKLMNDDDQVVVKQEGNQISLTDNETGNEYVIDLGMDGEESVEGEGEDMELGECVIKEKDDDIAGIPDVEDDETEDDEDIEFEFDLDDDSQNKPTSEGIKSKNVMKENKEMIFEVDLGYTDNYQDKDPIQGLSMTEPSKSGKSWEKGVPTGTEKPWAGDAESEGKPFGEDEKPLDECDGMNCEETVDENVTVVKNQKRKSPKTLSPNSGDVNAPKVSRHISVAGDYKEIAEAYKKENAMLKKAIKELKENVEQAYIVNTNLAKITRLFTENTVSQDEKREIVNRFSNEAKTLEQSNALYESIDKQLKKNSNLTLESSKPMNVEGSAAVNETKYQSKDLLNTLDLIKRMQNC